MNSAQPTGGKLLIVDDEPLQLKALCDTLEDVGFSTTGFASAHEALARLRSGETFDVLLTDLMMPEMDGIALMRAAQESDSQLVGIVMTGHAAVDTAVEAMKAGALDYILKPMRLKATLPIIERALTIRRLRTANAELEQRVRERSQQLEIANRELEAFSYSVSHDLRAPLRAIAGYSEMLMSDHLQALPEEAARLLRNVRAGTERMERLIEDLLAFARFSRQPLQRQRVRVSDIAQDVMSDLRTDHPGRDIEVRIDPSPEVMADASLLRQVLVNLLSNACKFTRHQPQARIEVGSRLENGMLIFHVRDNGAGFDMKYAAKLFGVFQRLHRTEEFEGTGIGLSIVQRIIERHGGRVWAEAKPGEGATFQFSLPAAGPQ